jgi:hypothetical protein
LDDVFGAPPKIITRKEHALPRIAGRFHAAWHSFTRISAFSFQNFRFFQSFFQSIDADKCSAHTRVINYG